MTQEGSIRRGRSPAKHQQASPLRQPPPQEMPEYKPMRDNHVSPIASAEERKRSREQAETQTAT
jgi:hypothetical protein